MDLFWVFGYGSLVWRPAFPFVKRKAGFVDGWARRFWQGSTDHRGVPGAPGRVVTLIEAPGEQCWGIAYAVEPEHRLQVLAELDFREKGGYERRRLEVHLNDGTSIESLVYFATRDNPNYLGPAELEEIACQVRRSHGPSGANVEYVLRLATALAEIGVEDRHVSALARLVAG